MKKLNDFIKIKNFFDKDYIVLDIETSGVSRINSQVLVIGLLSSDGTFEQYAINNEDEEKELLETIALILENKNIITFNGDIFDIPFIKSRMEFHGIKVFHEKSTFDLRKYLIKNKLITDINKFSLNDLEIYSNIDRYENFELESDIKFYTFYELKNADYDKVLLHNKYDVINTQKLLYLVNKIEEKKTFHINNYDININSIFHEKNTLLIKGHIRQNIIDYFIDNPNFTLSLEQNNFTLKLRIYEGYLKDKVLGYVYITNYIPKFNDESPYELNRNIIPIFESRYFLANIKNIMINIFKDILN